MSTPSTPQSELEDLKQFLRIDGSEQDSLLSFFVDVAKKQLARSGVPKSDDEDYKMATMLHVAGSMGHTEYEKMLQDYVLKLKDFGGDTDEV